MGKKGGRFVKKKKTEGNNWKSSLGRSGNEFEKGGRVCNPKGKQRN